MGVGWGAGEGVVGLYGENWGWRGDGSRYSLRASNIYNVKRYDITMKIAKIMSNA